MRKRPLKRSLPSLGTTKFHATAADPFYSWLSFERLPARMIGGVSVAITAASLLIINLIQGTLGWGGALERIISDVRVILGAESSEALSTELPLLRDYSSLVLFASLSVYFAVLQHQLRAITDLIPSLESQEVVRLGRDRDYFDRRIESANRGIEKVRRYWWLRLLIAIGLMTQIMVVEHQSGVLPRLAELATGDPAALYAGWWAGIHNPLGFGFYFVFGVASIYWVLLQNEIGLRLVVFFWRVRRVVSYGINLQSPDGHFGWASFRRVMSTVYGSIVLHAVALSGFFLGFSLSNARYVVVLVFIFFVLNPVYIGGPLYFIRTSIERDKWMQVNALLDFAPRQINSYDDMVKAATVRSEVEIAIRAPSIPFNVRAIVVSVAIYAIPVGLTIGQIVMDAVRAA